MKKTVFLLIGLLTVSTCCIAQSSETLWNLANKNKDLLRVSTIFTAHNMRRQLATEEGLQDAIDWCKETGVTRVFIEAFRDGYTAEREALENARDRFRASGIEVSGCVTTTRVSQQAAPGGWNVASCYTDMETQEMLQKIFEYTASIFDVIMIDDFLFTECECEKCIAARGDQSWDKYRSDLMVKMSRERILQPARAVNPKVKIINKYPLWYDEFQKTRI